MDLVFLFLTSFLAGSFIPMASEAHLILLHQDGGNPWTLISIATMGNSFGGMTCYFIGQWGGKKLIQKFLKSGEQRIDYWHQKLEGKSEWTAFFCWLPLVGEIIAAVLGLISNNWKKIFLFMTLGKFFRYALILKVIDLMLF